jgi:hypothetical protein
LNPATARDEPDDGPSSLLDPHEVRRRALVLFERAAAGDSPLFLVDRRALAQTAAKLATLVRQATHLPPENCWQLWASLAPHLLDRLGDRIGRLDQKEQAAIGIEISVLAALLDAGGELIDIAAADAPGLRARRLLGLLELILEHDLAVWLLEPCEKAVHHLTRVLASSAPPAADMLHRLQSGSATTSPAAALRATLETAAVAPGEAVAASELLRICEATLRPAVASGVLLLGKPLGDVWRHPAVAVHGPTDGLLPFHALAIRLVLALQAPLAHRGIRIDGLEALPLAATRRAGALLWALGTASARHPAVLRLDHPPTSDVAVEWRALTVAMADNLATELAQRCPEAVRGPEAMLSLLEVSVEDLAERPRPPIRIAGGAF